VSQTIAPGSPSSVVISSSGDLNWSPWLLFRTASDVVLNNIPTTPAVYEIGVALQELSADHKVAVVPTRERIRVTSIYNRLEVG
jgi:hypothetical protein